MEIVNATQYYGFLQTLALQMLQDFQKSKFVYQIYSD